MAENEKQSQPSARPMGFRRLLLSAWRCARRAARAVVGWIRRAFFGGSNTLFQQRREGDVFAVEDIESPLRQRVKAFLNHKAAVGAALLFIGIFLVMLIGPLFYPLDLSYMEQTQKNIAPGLDMMSVPRRMKKEIDTISSRSKFTVGLSKSGEVFVWGDSKLLLADLSRIPDEVEKSRVVHLAAGTDHVIAITEDGRVHGWGANANAQYGEMPRDNPTLQFMYTYAPSEITGGRLEVGKIRQLTCGNQVSAIVMEDGSVYLWGNHNLGATNMAAVKRLTNVSHIIFTDDSAVAILQNGDYDVGSRVSFDYATVRIGGTLQKVRTREYLEQNRLRIVGGGSAGSSVAFVLDNGQVMVAGNSTGGENQIPPSLDGVRVASVAGGDRHYTAITEDGRVVCWGSNALGQTDVPKRLSGVSGVFVGPFQNYAVDKQGKLIDTWGSRGYLMGTDEYGRDIFNRIVNGGRLTMTIGAIAVIISSVIGIIVGCLAGYFGGWVDMLLMRVAEMISAIPFIPFALILSLVASELGLAEMTRIVMIMVILGVLSWPGLARLVRGQVLSEREKEFVVAAKAMGVKERKIAFYHILPNVVSIIIVSMTLDFAGCMLTESSLSYLGFGVRLPRPTWGNMLNGASNSIVIQNYWWQWVFPSLFLLVTTICINMIGDALRDVMDPKSEEGR